MDTNRIDRLTRALAATAPRRGGAKALVGSALTVAIGVAGIGKAITVATDHRYYPPHRPCRCRWVWQNGRRVCRWYCP